MKKHIILFIYSAKSTFSLFLISKLCEPFLHFSVQSYFQILTILVKKLIVSQNKLLMLLFAYKLRLIFHAQQLSRVSDNFMEPFIFFPLVVCKEQGSDEKGCLRSFSL